MNKTLCVHGREKRPQPTCKRKRNRSILKKKLASMTKKGRKEYLKNKAKKAAKRRDDRQNERIRIHKLRIERSRRIGKKHSQEKARRKIISVMRKVVDIKKKQPDKEAIARKKANAEQRLVKRRVKKLVAFALRNDTDPIKLISFIVSDIGIKHLQVGKYQKMILVSQN